MITIVGATGHTGKLVAERLLAKGEKIRVIGRDAGRLAALVARGAEAAVGDAGDAAFLERAFKGADAVYTLLPPDAAAPSLRAVQDRVGEATVRALRAAGTRFVVFLSSQGGEQPSGTGPIVGLHAQEERLRELGVNVLVLRPAYFMENLFSNLGLIKQQGLNGGAIAPDLPMPMIATADIGEAAAAALIARDWKGQVVRDLLGPRDLTQREATAILGALIGKPELPYVQFPYPAFTDALTHMGLSRDYASKLAEMAQAMNEGHIKPPTRSPSNTTSTRFEDFAQSLAQAYQAQ